MLIDFSRDGSLSRFHHIIKLAGIPEFVKDADSEELIKTAELPTEAFAQPFDRLFPMHTKAATWISYGYFLSQKNQMSKSASFAMERRFEKAADFWGITLDLKTLDKALQEPEPTPVKTACALEAENLRFYPIDTAANVLKSATQFAQTRQNFPYALRKEAATAILRAASAMGIDWSHLDQSVERSAGLGLTLKEAAVNELLRRVSYAGRSNKDVAAPLLKAAAVLEQQPMHPPIELMQKIANIIDTFDRGFGITKAYGKDLPLPEDALFTFTKSAMERAKSSVVRLTTGHNYLLSDMSKAAEAFKAAGDEYLDSVSLNGRIDLRKVAEVLPTMPRDDANVFERSLSILGVSPLDLDQETWI